MYTNENFPLPVVEYLREFGHDVLTSDDEGRANRSIPDEEVLAFAKIEARILLTMNRKHFVRLHKLAPQHVGIVVCTFDPDFARQAQQIHTLLGTSSNFVGTLARVNRPPI
jgi:hypothetical protein